MKKEKINLVSGTQYQDITIVSIKGNVIKGKSTRYLCKCKCGRFKTIVGSYILRNYKECNICKHKSDINLENKTIFDIKIIERNGYHILPSGFKIRKWKIECLKCGFIKSVLEPVILKGEIKTCGRKCCKSRGSDHPLYKPDIDRSLKTCMDRRVWAKKILELDNYTCYRCHKKSTHDLCAHHLYSWDWYKDGRLNTDNGRCLCKDCHNLFHQKYGAGKNTKEQFIEFLQIYGLH